MIKILKHLKPFKTAIVVTLGLILLQSFAELYLPTLMAEIVNQGIINGDVAVIVQIGSRMLVVTAFGAACTIIASYLSAKTAAGFGRNLRGKVFSRVESFSLYEFDKIGTASLITRTTNDVTQVQMVIMVMLRMMVMAPMMIIGGVIMAVSKDPTLSLLFVVIVPLIGGTIGVIATKGIPLFKAMQLKLDKLNLVLRERLMGIRVIRAFNRIDHEKERFKNASLDLTDTAIRVNRIMAALMPVLMLVMNLTTVSILWFGGIRIDTGFMQVGDMMAFIQYAMMIMFSLVMISFMFVMIPRASASAIRINEVLDTEAEIRNLENAKSGSAQAGYVEFRNVSFRYPGAEKPALCNITFAAGPGEVTAIIGGTGSGKSTLVNLIPRFYDVDQGSILVDGIDIRELTQESLRRKIGLVPQKAVLFTGTVSDNIRYGNENASEEEVIEAAATAQTEDFISSLKEGFNTVISQGGTNVSGGQKQRLAIARALVRKPEIYIFDDSFSALDFQTDANLRAALKEEIAQATVLIVAQRVNTVVDAHRIIVLEKGSIVSMGTHKELLQSCDVYKEIVLSQLPEEEIA